MKAHVLLAVIGAATLIAGCSTHTGGLRYTTPERHARVPEGSPPVVLGAFTDKRGEPPTWLGAIRGGFGNQLKSIESDQPVSALVREAFADGLRARGISLSGAAGRPTLTGAVEILQGDQYARRGAEAKVAVSVVDAQGRPIFARTYDSNLVDGSLVTLSAGVFGSPELLRELIARALSEVVDKALNDPALRAALQV